MLYVQPKLNALCLTSPVNITNVNGVSWTNSLRSQGQVVQGLCVANYLTF